MTAGSEPAPDGYTLEHEQGRSLRGRYAGRELFRYVYQPWDAPVESPQPYFHPLWTLGGDPASIHRPHDHVWHKGLSWSLCNVGTENFWGGPTFTREHQGYAQLPNNGAMRHIGFDALGVSDGGIRFDERLDWITEAGQTWITEHRQVAVRVLPAGAGGAGRADDAGRAGGSGADRAGGAWPGAGGAWPGAGGAWQLAFRTTMRNVSDATIPIGSPTTEGRDNAGYSGLFWRGPRSFSGGLVRSPEGDGADDLMGWRGPWLAFVGRHDDNGRATTVLMRDHPGNPRYPVRWFARSGIFACLCPAPFFDTEYPLEPGTELSLRYDAVIADGDLDRAGCATLASLAADLDL